MIALDTSLIVQMVNFLILLWILNRFLFKPILRILDERRGRIQESDRAVQDMESRASEQWDAYQRQLQEAKIEANVQKERLKGEGLDAAHRLLEQVRVESAGRMEEARDKIAEEASRARDLLKSQAEGIAREMAEKILGRSLQ